MQIYFYFFQGIVGGWWLAVGAHGLLIAITV